MYVLSKNIKKVKTKSTENCHFYSRGKSLYIAWACFRNDIIFSKRGYETLLIVSNISAHGTSTSVINLFFVDTKNKMLLLRLHSEILSADRIFVFLFGR